MVRLSGLGDHFQPKPGLVFPLELSAAHITNMAQVRVELGPSNATLLSGAFHLACILMGLLSS